MKMVLELDGRCAVVSGQAVEPEPVAEEVQAHVTDREPGERVKAAFLFEGTRAELLGAAQALDRMMRLLRGEGVQEARLPFDFEARVVAAECPSL